ncbi:cation-translocating P-type ATPase [Ignavigranum ruoffiae]|uniref:cation-translocating P-type ATPase n=1 Tax=Ignavigranum ruoffiae TaxID=89093 RepID=UPI0024ACF99B|nr:cation-translocating P-type ATPase [Ignavigranum ruoffiae]
MSEEKIKAHHLSADQVSEHFDVDPQQGLSDQEAKTRLEKYGANELNQEETTTIFQKFIEQFKDFMIIVLLIAAIISAVIGIIEGEGISDAIIILVVVILNAIMGVFQESKAEEAINALKDLSSPEATVRRGGEFRTIDSKELVPGDIVLLEAGNVVPADLRLFESNSLQIEEAALTGESVPVFKDIDTLEDEEVGLGDRENMAFSSTNVTYGRGLGIVTATGMGTEVGHIAQMLSSADKQVTPLQRDQENLGKTLTKVIIAIAIITFVVGYFFKGMPFVTILLISISLAVAAIPEGLPAITTIILSIGTETMAKRNALVRTLPAVETLGSTQVISSDKTGTLTLNEMTIEKVFYNNEIHEADEDIDLELPLLKAITYANDSNVDSQGKITGDPTETAMIQYALDKDYPLKENLSAQPRVGEVPFDSARKLMSTIHKLDDGRYVVAVKGAPDQLLQRTDQIILNGEVQSLDDKMKQDILDKNNEMARQALRVLAGAYKYIDELPNELTTETIEKDLIFAGLVGMIDPERAEAAEAIQVAKGAGMRTVMITGDHAVTAQAIAERLGILKAGEDNSSHVITGAELNELSDEELAQKVTDLSVYARVSPEHKVRIIKAWQTNDVTISMTGDGVNDAPSLKQADIGVAMGITGTEVSKGASDMILADDNFATIVAAVEEGRKVFSNIQKAVQYLLSANLGEVMTIFLATLFGWQVLEPVHILWINLVTDVFPAIALGMEPAEVDSMNHPPRSKDQSFLSFGVMPSIIYQGILEGSITLFIYWFGRYVYASGQLGYDVNSHLAINMAETMAFATLGLIQLFHSYNVKYIFKSLFSQNPFNNKFLNGATILSGILLFAVILIPGINTFFDVSPIGVEGWSLVIGAAFLMIIVVEIIKAILRANKIDEKYIRTIHK